MAGNRSVRQPALDIMAFQGRGITAVAKAIGVPLYELRDALHGRQRPSIVVRERLPLLLGVPLVSLFSERQLQDVRMHSTWVRQPTYVRVTESEPEPVA
jgi:hypothetical protein